jgi:hypothetical protein
MLHATSLRINRRLALDSAAEPIIINFDIDIKIGNVDEAL